MRIIGGRFFNYKIALFMTCVLILACSRRDQPPPKLSVEHKIQISESAVNINTATAAELEKLPHVGERTAREIVAHRERFGKFRKPEFLMFVRGISDRRFREIRHLIKAE